MKDRSLRAAPSTAAAKNLGWWVDPHFFQRPPAAAHHSLETVVFRWSRKTRYSSFPDTQASARGVLARVCVCVMPGWMTGCRLPAAMLHTPRPGRKLRPHTAPHQGLPVPRSPHPPPPPGVLCRAPGRSRTSGWTTTALRWGQGRGMRVTPRRRRQGGSSQGEGCGVLRATGCTRWGTRCPGTGRGLVLAGWAAAAPSCGL